MFDSLPKSWRLWGRHEPKGQPAQDKKMSPDEEIEDLKRRVEISDKECSGHWEKIMQLELKADDYRKENDHLQCLAERRHRRMSNNSRIIGQLKREVEQRGSQNRMLQQEAEHRDVLYSEKIRRQNESLSELRARAGKAEQRHMEELQKLYIKINTLQREPAQLSDEHLAERMRRVGHNLDAWIRSNLQGLQIQEQEGSDDAFPCNSVQLQACIRAHAADCIHALILDPFYFGMPDYCWSKPIESLRDDIEHHLPVRSLDKWRAITCDFLENITEDNQQRAIQDLCDHFERSFGQYTSTDEKSKQHQLQRFLYACSDLKALLSRQSARYLFHCSEVGAPFALDSMAFGGGNGGPGSRVKMTLWPALIKQTLEGNKILIEKELVWTD